MKTKILCGIAAGIVGISLLVFANSGPRTYDDCILENMQGVQTNGAATLIRKSCRAKFPGELISSGKILSVEEFERKHPGGDFFSQYD